MTTPASELQTHELGTDAGPPGAGPLQQIAGRSPTQLALARFRRDKGSMVSFVIVVIYILVAIAAPILTKMGVLDPFSFHSSSKFLDINAGGIPRGALSGISLSHPLGIEPGTGRDLLSREVLGITTSLTIGLAATLIAVVVGTVLGIVSGFTGGIVDSLIGRLVDLTLSFPLTLMLLALSTTLVTVLVTIGVPSGDLANGAYVILVLGAFGWPPITRIVRGQVLSLREREFVEAATLMGAPRRRMYFKEILPNLWAPLLVYFTLTMPAYISAEAALSFLGVGIKPPTPTLGNILTDSVSYSQSDFFFFFTPAFLLALVVLCFNLLGDGLRDALDPRGAR
jgi:peptide/nickel transport system permease protein